MSEIQNVEIKARSRRNKELHNILMNELNADFKGLDTQVDTYFNVQDGRLKLRSGNVENSLIFYKRSDEAKTRESKILLEKLEPNNNLREVLAASNGIKIEVKKERKIYFIDNVKFHLDFVEGLGEFVEIEAIAEDGSRDLNTLKKQCDHYVKLFELEEKDFESLSYSDLVAQ